MFGLDERIAAFSDGTAVLVVLAVAILLGLRHATDPDHLAAVSTLISCGPESGTRRAAARARHGVGPWPCDNALRVRPARSLLYRAYLPGPVQQGAETAVGLLIVGLAVCAYLRWHRGVFHPHGPDMHSRPARTRFGATASASSTGWEGVPA